MDKLLWIERLYGGRASLRDYQVRKAELDGGATIVLRPTKAKMTLTPQQLMENGIHTGVKCTSKFNGEVYELIDFPWKPDTMIGN